MEIPISVETRIKIISRKDPTISEQCKVIIEDKYQPDIDDFWFTVGIWLKYVDKAIKLKDYLHDTYSIAVSFSMQNFEKYPHCELARSSLNVFIQNTIEEDRRVIRQKVSQVVYQDEYGDSNHSEIPTFKQKYFDDRLKFKVTSFIEGLTEYCDKNWLYSLDFISICYDALNTIIASVQLEDYGEQISVEDLNPYEYEKFCSNILNDNGWSAYVTQGGGDQGVDVIAEKNDFKLAIQCKLYNSKVPNKAVQEVQAGKGFYGCDAGIVVSTAEYTKSSMQLAQSLGVLLVSTENLVENADFLYEKHITNNLDSAL